VIAAGSLLEFALGEISFPVGRVDFLDVYPMTFREFLLATGKEMLAAQMEFDPEAPKTVSLPVHNMFLDELKKYFFIGGMPEAVKTYSETQSFTGSFEVQEQILKTMREDFSKYSPRSDKQAIDLTLCGVAKLVGQQIKYTQISQDYSSPTIKKSFEYLELARLIHRVKAASPEGLPLSLSASLKTFKAIMLDIGLYHRLHGLNPSQEWTKDLLSLYRGAMAEQFVGQECLAKTGELYYWSRPEKSSMAEVDYLVVRNNRIYPVEVKSSVSGRLRSLHLLLKSHPHYEGLVLSEREYSELKEQHLKFVPLYLAGEI
jgi:predicted AAA+ superfamily ATPase